MKNKVGLLLRLIAAAILLQTLFFKFTGAPESKYIFSTLGVEPWGRWASGIFELIASILLLVPRTQLIGAVLAAGVMGGAILSHIFILGIVVQDDGGTLFALAIGVLLCSLGIIYIRKEEILFWIGRLKKKAGSQ